LTGTITQATATQAATDHENMPPWCVVAQIIKYTGPSIDPGGALVGATGAKGDKGDKGDTGATGATGDTGPQGGVSLPYYAVNALPASATHGDMCIFDPGLTGGSWCMGVFDSTVGGIGAWVVTGQGIDGFATATVTVGSASGWRKFTTGSVAITFTYLGSYYIWGDFDTTVSAAGVCGLGVAPFDTVGTGTPTVYNLQQAAVSDRVGFNLPRMRTNTVAGTKSYDMRVYSAAAATMSPLVSPRLYMRAAYCYGVA
jgi:hypothetical protein